MYVLFSEGREDPIAHLHSKPVAVALADEESRRLRATVFIYWNSLDGNTQLCRTIENGRCTYDARCCPEVTSPREPFDTF
jgi:hypothetical protein